MNKVAPITLSFWIIKICATTLGETAGDLLSMTLNIGYGISSVILISLFLVSVVIQLKASRFHPAPYWTVILATSTAGTTMSDFMDRTLDLGYAKGSLLLITLLLIILTIWRLSEKSLLVSNIHNVKAELFYWTAILLSNTLGTALGDYLADDSGLGFLGGTALIASLLALTALAFYFSKISHVLLFWIAFILTRPFGATFSDLLTKPADKGGLNFGTIGSSAVLASIVVILVLYTTVMGKRSANTPART
ncbi:MAG: hypothetical protein ABUL58_03835 [Steroidobacter sp.]